MSQQGGFSLIELMIVVAIIGVLSTVAVPNYQRMAGRARQVEAREALAAVYTAEKSFYADQSSYTLCVFDAGYSPTASSRFYLSGFYSDNGSCGAHTCWTSDFASGAGCTANAPSFSNNATFNMNHWANAGLVGAGIGGNFAVSTNVFNAVAFGSITPDATVFDVWQMTQDNVMSNIQPGY